jgi:glycosyltransferase involved in cell wall biosynthesis
MLPKEMATVTVESKDEREFLASIKVSIVIPFYNRIGYLVEAIASAQAQTHTNVEIILVDDGSSESIEALTPLIQADQRIAYFHQENKGPAAARNHAILKASGKYIAFLDSDDQFEHDKILAQLAFMEKNNLAFSYTNYCRVAPNGTPLNKGMLSPKTNIESTYPHILTECMIATPTVMVLRSALTHHAFNEHLKIGEDVCMWINLAREMEFGYLGAPLTRVRISSASHSLDPLKSSEGNINIVLFLIKDPNHAMHRKYIAQLLVNTSYLLDPDLNAFHPIKKLRIIAALSWDRAKHLNNLRREKVERIKSKTHFDNQALEGKLVKILKPFFPKKIWRFCTTVYKSLKN